MIFCDKLYVVVAPWLTLMADNKPPFFHHFSRLDIFRGLLLSPKKQTGDRFEHFCFLFVSSWGVCLCCCSCRPSLLCSAGSSGVARSLYLLKSRKQSHIHVHTASVMLTLMLTLIPNWLFGSGPSQETLHSLLFFKIQATWVSWQGCPMRFLLIQWYE